MNKKIGRPKGSRLVKIEAWVRPDDKKKLITMAKRHRKSLSRFVREKIEAFLAIAECGKEGK